MAGRGVATTGSSDPAGELCSTSAMNADELLRSVQRDHQRRQLAHIIERLRVRHPAMGIADIDEIVQAIYCRFAQARVRDYVPLLVERAAQEHIVKAKHDFTSAAVPCGAVTTELLVSEPGESAETESGPLQLAEPWIR
ncbi:hypothetical protein [Williamsia sp. 1135]|uniref:three-helix bundle dimerization domain-containing protein n=1 Tax=Williamsia sp. 1135 TaxID=1889262 RepID=UPI000A23F302|nr:hypothetical protein [Williamsia sp. 1135]ORM36794.1 hypothetical protein BFL43_06260 [Williamsia sp. 1135]